MKTDISCNVLGFASIPSSETQGQLAGAGKSLNGREKKLERIKIKNDLTFLRPNFFLARLDFFPPSLTAPGSPRMFLP